MLIVLLLFKSNCDFFFIVFQEKIYILQERKAISPDGDKDKDPLLLNLLEEGHEIVTNLKQLNLRPQICYRDTEPINLYHKVGHGTLDMYVLSPAKDSREVKEFIQKWNTNDQKLFSSKKDAKDFIFPLQNMVSICALLVWQPASPTDSITRLLFPGSTPHQKIFEGLDRLKHLEFMKHPVCTAKTLTPSGSIHGLKARQNKNSTVLDKIAPPEKSNKVSDNKQQKEKTPPLTENKGKTENKTTPTENKNKVTNGTTNGDVTEKVAKRDSVESEKSDPASDAKKLIENGAKTLTTDKKSETKEIKKENDKSKAEPKPKISSKTRSESLARKAQEKKPKPIEKKTEQQKPSPKKAIDSKVTNGTDKPVKEAAKSKLITKQSSAAKSSPTSTPAKSTKDANNRKVIESKKAAPKKESIAKDAPKPQVEKKEVAKVERKPISRRPKPASPGRSTKTTESPTKKIVPKDKNGVSRTIKLDKEGTTDSSAVSTPSADQDTLKKLDESKLTKTEIEELRAKELADLKEEQEVVKEIEAVFQKDEEKKAVKVQDQNDLRKIKDMSSLEDKTTEPEDEEEEYIIIEKEEIEDSINEAASATKGEDEIQKHKRDSEESEKPKLEGENLTEEEAKQPELMKADTCEVLEIVPPKEEEIPIPAEMTRSKEDSHKTEEMSKEVSVTSPEDKYTSSEKKTTDTRDEIEEEIEEGLGEEIKPSQEKPLESQPEEKYSTTVESGATTAPTLPEDERIPLDEIKEDIVDPVEEEEKYVKEETKEKEHVPVVVLPQKVEPPKMGPVAGMKFDAHQQHIRDIVKTPDEVADLPVHEEVDFDYDYKKDDVKKAEEHKEDKGPSKPDKVPEVETKAEKEEIKTTEDSKNVPKEEPKDASKEHFGEEQPASKPDEVQVKVTHEELHAHVTDIHDSSKDIQKVSNDELEKELVVEASTSQVAKEDHTKHDSPKAEEDTNKLEDQKEEAKVIPSPLDIVNYEEKADVQKEEKDSKETTPEKVEREHVTAADTSKPEETRMDSPTTPLKDVTSVVSDLFQDKLSHILTTDEIEENHDVQETDEGSPSESKLDLDSKTTEHADEKDMDDDYVPALRREVDIAKIVTSVAHVLKSDAPLEELASEIPHEFSPYHSTAFGIKSYTTELRETHITTVDSPVSESRNILQDNKEIDTNKAEESVCMKETTQSFLEKEQQEASHDVEVTTSKSNKASDLIRDSNVLIESSSKMISSIKSSSPDKEHAPEDQFDNDPGIVHRMLVTASSEDGGEEIEICPKGSIIFHKPDNSGKSTPECGHSPRLPPHDDIFNQAFEHKGSHLEEVAEALLDAKEKADEEQPEKDVLRSGKSTPAPVRSGKSSPDLEKNYEKFMEQHPHVNDIPSEEYPNVDRKDSAKTISESLEGSKVHSLVSTPDDSDDEEGKLHKQEQKLEAKVGQVISLSDKLEQMKKKVSELDELLAKDDGDEADEIFELSPKASPESDKKDFIDTKVEHETHDSLLESKTDNKVEEIVASTVESGKITPENKFDESAGNVSLFLKITPSFVLVS